MRREGSFLRAAAQAFYTPARWGAWGKPAGKSLPPASTCVVALAHAYLVSFNYPLLVPSLSVGLVVRCFPSRLFTFLGDMNMFSRCVAFIIRALLAHA